MLPSTRRPKEVEEERTLRLEQQQQEQRRQTVIKLKITKEDIFMKSMKEWYTSLTPREKLRVTPRRLKRKAVCVCFKEQMAYDALHPTWLSDLQAEVNLKMYKRKETGRKTEAGGTNKSVESSDGGGGARPNRKRERSKERQMEGDAVDASSSVEESPGPSNAAEASAEKLVETGPKKRGKKIVDLSGDPPPPAWVEAYAKGIILPRVLTTYSMEDRTIIFYDYDPKLKDSEGNEVKLSPGSRPGRAY